MEDDGAGICDIERVGSGCFIYSIEGDGEVCRLERGSCFIVNDAEDDDCGSFVVGVERGGSGGAIFRFEDGDSGDVVRRTEGGGSVGVVRGDKDDKNCSLVFGVEDGENGEDIREIEGRGGSVARGMVDVGIGLGASHSKSCLFLFILFT